MLSALYLLATIPLAVLGASVSHGHLPRDAPILWDPSLLLPGRSVCSPWTDLSPWTPLSCGNTTVQTNTCCFNSPGGHFLSTQFWDWNSPLEYSGPNDTWTLHGLWPDHCDGNYDSFCDPGRQVTNITQILEFFGETALLTYMHTYWKDNTGNDETFWEHEFNKHGTCISSLEPQCIENYHDRNDVLIFIKRAISLYMFLPTHEWLSWSGIVPSTTTMYNLSDVTAALQKVTGHAPSIQCNGNGKKYLNELWYHFETKGSVIDGIFVHADTDSPNPSCASEVWYWPKGVPTPTPTSTSTTATSTSSAPSSTPTGDQGTIQVFTSNGTNVGCILSKGTWSQQTCATFHPLAGSVAGTYAFNSSKGLCAIDAVNGTLSCASTNTIGSDFTNSTVAAGSLLAYAGNATFSADVLPTGAVQSTVWATGDHAIDITLVYTRT